MTTYSVTDKGIEYLQEESIVAGAENKEKKNKKYEKAPSNASLRYLSFT